MTWLLGTNVLSEICKEPLAATAKVHKLALVTRNTRDVAGLGAEVLDPFAAAQSREN